MKDLPPQLNPNLKRIALTFFIGENKQNFIDEFKRIWPGMNIYTLDDNDDLVFVDIPNEIIMDVFRLSVICSNTKFIF